MNGDIQERSKLAAGGEIKSAISDKFERPHEMHK